jgi:hypothetical protein
MLVTENTSANRKLRRGEIFPLGEESCIVVQIGKSDGMEVLSENEANIAPIWQKTKSALPKKRECA